MPEAYIVEGCSTAVGKARARWRDTIRFDWCCVGARRSTGPKSIPAATLPGCDRQVVSDANRGQGGVGTLRVSWLAAGYRESRCPGRPVGSARRRFLWCQAIMPERPSARGGGMQNMSQLRSRRRGPSASRSDSTRRLTSPAVAAPLRRPEISQFRGSELMPGVEPVA